MNKIEFNQHKQNILNLLNQVIIETNRLSQKEFLENEQLRERIFSQLQEIGQASYELTLIKPEGDTMIDEHEIFDKLAKMKNIRYHQEAERSIGESLWNIIKFDLMEIENELERSVKVEV